MSIPAWPTPKREAEVMLSELWPENCFPVDPVTIAKRLEIDVQSGPLEPNVSGGLVKIAGRDPIILLNKSDHPHRKRFTCAHEIGHFVLRVATGGESEYEYKDLRGVLASLGVNKEEIFANEFAANLLMPENEVRRLCAASTPRWQMAQHFGVSDDAIRFRLENLKISLGEPIGPRNEAT